MVRPLNRLLGLFDRIRRLTSFKIFFGSQQRKVEGSDLDPLHLMAAVLSTLGIFIGERVAKMPCHRIGMTLDNDDVLRHVRYGDVDRRKSTRLNSSHPSISYAVFCLKKKKTSYGKSH